MHNDGISPGVCEMIICLRNAVLDFFAVIMSKGSSPSFYLSRLLRAK